MKNENSMDINSIINFIKNKKQHIHDVNIKKKLDYIVDEILDLLIKLKPKDCNHLQYLILLLGVFSEILAGFKATALNENIITSKSLEDLDKIHSDMINFFNEEIKNGN